MQPIPRHEIPRSTQTLQSQNTRRVDNSLMVSKYTPSPDDIKKVEQHDAVRARVIDVAKQLTDAANKMAIEVQRPSERDRDSFTWHLVKHPDVTRAWVMAKGRTGIHVEAGHSVLLKAISMIR